MELPYHKIRTDLRVFLSIVACLLGIGFVFIYSSSAVFALEKFGAAHYFLKKHLWYFSIGVSGFFVFSAVPISWWLRLVP